MVDVCLLSVSLFYRLIALCSGKNEFDNAIWESGKSFENQRKLRNK